MDKINDIHYILLNHSHIFFFVGGKAFVQFTFSLQMTQKHYCFVMAFQPFSVITNW